jgi:acyl-CoA synthetase (AMP-forming)/AMP-acid ligase II
MQLLERNAQQYPQDVALVEINPDAAAPRERVTWKEYNLVERNPAQHYRRTLTWQEFDQKANRVANMLTTVGLTKGNRVGVLLMNGIEWLPIYFGILKMGALAVPLNFRYTADEIKYCIELADIDALFFGPEFIGRMEQICDKIPRVRNLFFVGDNCPTFADDYLQIIANFPMDKPDVELTEDDDAAIYFSSGTTGFPKAILHRHLALSHAAKVEQAHHGQTRDDVFLCIPPLYHTGAKMHWFGSLYSASRAVLLRGTSPTTILSAVSDERCTIVWLLVPWVQDILDAVDRGDIKLSDYHLEQWRLMHIGAQPVPPSLIKRWHALFPHHAYDTNYGLSESIGPGCVHLGVENMHKVGAIGIAGYGWQVRIVDSHHQDVPQGEVGELAVYGPGVMKCYYKDEAATREVLEDGWLYTGDMAMQDSDGFIFLVDRKKDVIISGGENLYPVQIEDFIRAHSAVKDVAVIGLPDKRQGEIAAAVIELKEGATCTEEQINEFCLGLPRYKRPRRIIFAKVPRNPTGKIEKPLLRKIYCGDSVVAMQNEIKPKK